MVTDDFDSRDDQDQGRTGARSENCAPQGKAEDGMRPRGKVGNLIGLQVARRLVQ